MHFRAVISRRSIGHRSLTGLESLLEFSAKILDDVPARGCLRSISRISGETPNKAERNIVSGFFRVESDLFDIFEFIPERFGGRPVRHVCQSDRLARCCVTDAARSNYDFADDQWIVAMVNRPQRASPTSIPITAPERRRIVMKHFPEPLHVDLDSPLNVYGGMTRQSQPPSFA